MQKKIPMRLCTGCREKNPKRDMLRVVKPPDSLTVVLDFKGKAPGRGAYVCRKPECLKRAVKSRALERALEVKISQDIYETLAEQMVKSETENINE